MGVASGIAPGPPHGPEPHAGPVFAGPARRRRDGHDYAARCPATRHGNLGLGIKVRGIVENKRRCPVCGLVLPNRDGGKPPDKRRVYCGTACQETAWKRRARFRAAHALDPEDLRDEGGGWVGPLPAAVKAHVGLHPTPPVPRKRGATCTTGPGRPPRP